MTTPVRARSSPNVPNTIVAFEESETSCLVRVVVGVGPGGDGMDSAVGDTALIVLLVGVEVFMSLNAVINRYSS